MPAYNILLRDDKSLQYVRIDHKSDYPTVTFTRRPLDDGAEYYGPYVNGWAVKRALKYLRRIFPYAITKQQATLGSTLYQQIGLDPGVHTGKTSLKEYRANLSKLGLYLRGKKTAIVAQLEKDMKQAAKEQNFEKAVKLRNQMFAIKELSKQIIFSDKEFLDISKDKALDGLSQLLTLEKIPRTIEGFDISHMSGKDVVASMVVFTNGVPNKTAYRKFKLRVQQNNDFASMKEVIGRRLSEKRRKEWGVPDLFLIDGGKGQLASALAARNECGMQHVPMIGLAKREEEIVVHTAESAVTISQQWCLTNNVSVRTTEEFLLLLLGTTTDVVKLLQRIRDESHRFAVSYHTVLKSSRQTTSWLDDVPTIGPATKKKLLKTFGSSRGVLQARQDELVHMLGEKKATILQQYMRAERKNNK